MVGLPLGSTAAAPLALVFMPQPKLTVGLPEKFRPVATVFLRLMTQYLPLCTMAAVADAVIVGAAVMNRPEKDSACDVDMLTWTAFQEAAVHEPVVGADSTAQVGVVP